MFGSLGGPELLLILLLALLLFGPRKLPEIGRTIGRGLSEFRKATHEFKMNLQREVELEQVREARDTARAAGTEIAAAASTVARGTIDPEDRSAASGDAPAPSPDAPQPGRS